MGIWVGRYSMVGGEPREATPWIVDRRRVGHEDSVRLVVLAEPADERSAPFCAEVAEAIAALFGRESLSITGGLLRALQQAHSNLAEWNRRSLHEHRIAVGVSCVAIRDTEATIALAGPGSAYRGGTAGVTRFSTEGTPAERPLGGDEPVEPQFLTTPFRDTTILLLTSSAEAVAGEQTIARAVAAGPERALGELYPHTRGMRDMSAVLLADLDVEEEDVAPIVPAPVEPVTSPPATLDSGAEPPGLRRRRSGTLPAVRAPARAVGRGGATSVRLPWRLIGGVSAAVLVGALFVGLVLLPLLDDDHDKRITDLLAQATAELQSAEQARSAGDATAERAAIEQASSTLERADAQAGDDPRVADLAATMEAARIRLDAVITVATLTRVATLDGILTAPAQPESLVAGGGALWLLERERGRIVRLDPESEFLPTLVYAPGEEYDGVIARAPLSMAWEAARGRLLVLDERRSLFAVPAGARAAPRALPLRGVEEIRSIAAIATYTGNLYVLDPEGGEIWRYVPAGDGFDSERQGLLGGSEIGTARALAVDGDVYVLEEDALRHFRLGDELPRLLAGIDAFPEAATGIAEDRSRGVIYVGDRERKRVVVSDRTGNFLRQYRHVDFDDMRGLALEPGGERLYVLTGRNIFAFDPLVGTASLLGTRTSD